MLKNVKLQLSKFVKYKNIYKFVCISNIYKYQYEY